ncbi:polymorphic toxin type 30 domain-containing protein [Oscillatoria salina]|uniref:polymorphic toxin type 30 domain-containing protein n=1 Tax=Oscillatoria salina TaxID=331517 RepID=UPI0013B6EE8F|nr:polymorphic toxin type 30 domain-containing protein [Oscillatoria salina]MBZ8183295.1 hypothetical protein [Oscillatoria salina IIICB1]NET87104.1 hypothetical protein [Kamptonema sp. SIO1D9]
MTSNQWNNFLHSTQGRYKTIQQASLAYRFRNIRGATYDRVIECIPQNATRRSLLPIPGKVTQGVEYKWRDRQDNTIRVRIHGPDPSAPLGSNARCGWVVRVQIAGRWLDYKGNFHHRNIHNQSSPYYDAKAVNDTHIPIQSPTGFI